MLKKILLPLIIVAVIVLLGVSVWMLYFRNPDTITNDNNIFQSNAQGLQVTAEVDPAGVTQDISSAGGEIQLDSSTDAAATLNLPEQALAGTESISLNNINTLTNLPSGMEFVLGVVVGPDGTLLDKPATLTLPVPAEQSAKNLVGFSYSGDGKDFQLYPISQDNNVATLQLTGFSGYGILVLPDNTTTPPAPTTIERQAKQYIASIVLSSGKKTGGVDSDHLGKIKNILTGWFNASVKPNLTAAVTDDSKLDAAVHEFISWQATVQWFGLDSSFQTEIDKSLNDIATAINNASAKASKQCTTDKDPTQAVKLLHYSKMVQLLGLEGKAGVSSDKINQMIKDCVNFELKITSHISMSAYDTISEIEASGTGTISYQDNMKLAGSAEVTVTRNQIVTMKPCTANVPETWTLTIPEFSIVTANTGSKFSMPLDLSLPVDGSLVWECGASLRDLVADASVTDPNNAWEFALLHDDERVGALGDPTSYVLPDWEMIGKGGVFAKKVYNRTVNNPFGIGNVTYQEQTTFELIPTPKTSK
ncbi:MAG: hypothetical protein WCV88_03945 [Patescibacteria group bacterium]